MGGAAVTFGADTIDLALPEPMGRGRRSPEFRAAYDARVEAWCQRLLELKPRIDFDPGARGWCYIMEEHGLSKGDFDDAEKLITACRKNGRLPLDFCGDDDGAREFIHVEELDDPDPEVRAQEVVNYVNDSHAYYDPVSFWDFQDHYVQMLVEKIGLRNLFGPVCEQHHVPLGNSRGSSSIWQRIRILERFAEWQAKGKRSVLLYCGDHDIHGLRISRSLRANLEEILGAFKTHFPEYEDFDLDEVVIERFGLNADFIEQHRLSWTQGLITGSGKDLGDPSHRKNGDHDVQDYIRRFGKRKVEADALVTRPSAGRALCESAILKFIDQDGAAEYEQERLKRQGEMRIALDRLLELGAP
jgi:hypothetical protein